MLELRRANIDGVNVHEWLEMDDNPTIGEVEELANTPWMRNLVARAAGIPEEFLHPAPLGFKLALAEKQARDLRALQDEFLTQFPYMPGTLRVFTADGDSVTVEETLPSKGIFTLRRRGDET